MKNICDHRSAYGIGKDKHLSKRSYIILVVALFFSILFCADTKATFLMAADHSTHVTDGAGLLSDKEISDLNNACQKVLLDKDTYIAIVTTNSIGNRTRKQYLEDYYDEYCASHSYDATALVLVNMDPSNRGVEIQGYGEAEYRVDGDTIESMLDDMVPDLQYENYYTAFDGFISSVSRAFEPPFYLQTWFSLLLALLIAGVVVFIMAYHSGGRMTVNENTYLDEGNSRLLARHDRYIRTTVSKRRKPQNDSNHSGSGGSGAGVSRGGHSHSGGGRSF